MTVQIYFSVCILRDWNNTAFCLFSFNTIHESHHTVACKFRSSSSLYGSHKEQHTTVHPFSCTGYPVTSKELLQMYTVHIFMHDFDKHETHHKISNIWPEGKWPWIFLCFLGPIGASSVRKCVLSIFRNPSKKNKAIKEKIRWFYVHIISSQYFGSLLPKPKQQQLSFHTAWILKAVRSQLSHQHPLPASRQLAITSVMSILSSYRILFFFLKNTFSWSIFPLWSSLVTWKWNYTDTPVYLPVFKRPLEMAMRGEWASEFFPLPSTMGGGRGWRGRKTWPLEPGSSKGRIRRVCGWLTDCVAG